MREPTFDEIEFVRVDELQTLGNYRVWLRFSNGREGVRDFSDMIADGGEMVSPLKNVLVFNGVYVDHGAPTWPNGFDIDPSYLLWEMKQTNSLSPE